LQFANSICIQLVSISHPLFEEAEQVYFWSQMLMVTSSLWPHQLFVYSSIWDGSEFIPNMSAKMRVHYLLCLESSLNWQWLGLVIDSWTI
jgi:hypothetical protein